MYSSSANVPASFAVSSLLDFTVIEGELLTSELEVTIDITGNESSVLTLVFLLEAYVPPEKEEEAEETEEKPDELEKPEEAEEESGDSPNP